MCCLTGSTASVTTASSPMPTGPPISHSRQLLSAPDPAPPSADSDRADGGHEDEERNICPCCGERMVIVETFEPGCQPRLWPSPAISFDAHDQHAPVAILHCRASSRPNLYLICDGYPPPTAIVSAAFDCSAAISMRPA